MTRPVLQGPATARGPSASQRRGAARGGTGTFSTFSQELAA